MTERSTKPTELDRSSHAQCKLATALGLVGGNYVRVPKLAYPAHSRLARLLQVGNGTCNLLCSHGKPRILVCGDRIEYLAGEVQYFTDHVIERSLRCLIRGRAFFVVSGADPRQSIAAITGCDKHPVPRLYLSTHCVVIIRANWCGAPAILHYGTCDEAVAEIARQANGLGIAVSDSQIRHLVPRLIDFSTCTNGSALSVQSQISGKPSEFSWSRIDAATELWLSRKPTVEHGGRTFLNEQLPQLFELLPQYGDVLSPAMDALMRWRETTRLPGGVTHGDFWLGNVLFSNAAISGIIDWEWSQSDGVELVDIMHMLFMSYAMSHNLHIAHCLRQFWGDEIDDGALRTRIASLGAKYGLDGNDLKFIALLLWFHNLYQKASRGRMPSASWTEDMISLSVPGITKWLSHNAAMRGMRAFTT